MDISDVKRSSPADRSSKCCSKIVKTLKINPKLLPLKAHYFFQFGSLAGVIPPMILYCQQLGASMSMIGLLFAVLPFAQFVAKPIVGALADKFQKHRTVFLSSIVILAFAFFSLKFIPKVEVIRTPVMGSANVTPEMIHWETLQEATLVTCESDNEGLLVCGLQDADRSGDENVTLSCNVTSGPMAAGAVDIRCLDQNDRPTTEDCTRDGAAYDVSRWMSEAELKALLTSRSSSPSSSAPGSHLFCRPIRSTSTNATSEPTTSHLLWQSPSAGDSILPPGCGRIRPIDQSTSSASCRTSNWTLEDVTLAQNVSYTETRGSSTLQFAWLWIGLILSYVTYGVILSISDTILLNVLGDDQSAYGTTRLFSSIGWGGISPIAAQIIEWTNEGVQEGNKDYSAGFYIFLVLILCDLAVSIPLKVVVPEKPEKLARNVLHLLANPHIVVFLVACLFQGMITGFTWTFEVLYANELNGNQLIIGLMYAVQCFCSEIPMFLLSGWVIRKLGHPYTISFVLFVTGLKAFLYSLVPSAWYLLLVALIHGATYGTFYATLATYANIIAPPGASATLQGIFQGVFEGAGLGIGSLIGGTVYEKVGGRMAFRIFGSSQMILSAIHLAIVFLLARIAAARGSSSSDNNLKPV